MIVRRVSYPLLALALVCTACQPPPQEPAALSADDVAAINGVIDAVIEADLAGDWAAVAENFVEDLVYMPPNLPAVEGRAAWLEWVQSLDFKIIELAVDVHEIDGRGDLAFVRGKYAETLAEGDAEPMELDGKWIWILRKQADGSWKVAVGISNSNTAPAEEGPET